MRNTQRDNEFLAPARIPFAYNISGKVAIELDEEKRIQSISFTRGTCAYSFSNFAAELPGAV